MALTGGDVFKGEDFSFHNSKAHYQGFFVRCQGWKARFIGKRCRRCKEEDSGIYSAQAYACLQGLSDGRESNEL